MSANRILVVDDETLVRDFVTQALIRMGHKVDAVIDGESAVERIDSSDYDLIVTDLMMPGISGLEVLAHAVRRLPETPVLMLTAYGTIENAVEAMRKGAYDYLTKPVDNELLKLTISRALQKGSLVRENRHLRSQVQREQGITAIVGSSNSMRDITEMLELVAPQPVDVLISGPSGTGKELVARALHWSSNRSKNPFIKMNCAALPDGLIESELFGHEKGAFTGAIKTRKGKFEAANGGTLLLDEVSEMPLPLQAKLLRVLQEREFERVGSNDTIKVDIRVVATTNRNLVAEVSEGRFREDLFFRLNVVPIKMPPLASRPDDIPALLVHFIEKYGERYGRQFDAIDDDAINYLKAQPWQGNVRELENRIERAVVLARDLTIHLKDVMLAEGVDTISTGNNRSFGQITIGELEKKHIIQTLKEMNFNRTKTADLLGISIRTLRNKLNEYRDQGEDIPKG
jgi:DNA-binding NtrC family response regulator